MIGCGENKDISLGWEHIEMSQNVRDSLFKLGKVYIPPYDSLIYYEYKRDTLKEDSIITIWYVQPDSNYWFEDIIYNYYE